VRFAIALVLAVLPGVVAPAQLISQGSGRARDVALTFDAGADRGYAANILQILERNHVKATFGMTGAWARANLDLLRRIHRDGDQIMNHTYDHRSFTGVSTRTAPLTQQQRTWEITQADKVIRSAVGSSTKPYFRPPFGDYDPATLALARALGYRFVVMWTLDSLGWEHLPAAQILRRCLSGLTPGTILLMHVGSQSQDALALQPLITAMKRRGYRFVEVAQLAGAH
jgi:peptidoglycan/xylan/chitin deacetylase (PgdA/CDA1 family)